MLIGISRTRSIGAAHIVDARFYDAGDIHPHGGTCDEPLVVIVTDAVVSGVVTEYESPYEITVEGERAIRVWGMIEGITTESGWSAA